MNQTLDDALALIEVDIPIMPFIINLILAAFLSIILKFIYEKYGESLSNRAQFAKNFLLITMTTMLIITIVKSSLALSLGLVGALSIIRFRAAIKEPEELSYIFLAIAIGLGLGANQTKITIIAFAVIILILLVYKKATKNKIENRNLYLTINCSDSNTINSDDILKILTNECDYVDLRRMDENKGQLEMSLMVEIISLKKLNEIKNKLIALDKNIGITFLDNKGLI
jgi:hypothetical protein